MKNNMLGKGIVFAVIVLFVGTTVVPTMIDEFHSVYGYLYIDDVLAPSGVEVKLSFESGDETDLTDSTGYYSIDFQGYAYEEGYFYVYYNGYWYVPVDNQSVEIDPEIVGYNIDLHIETVPHPDTVYVDDDFNESTPGWGYDHFDSVQDGVDAVNESGTVYVYNGTYYENVVIDKTINLIGEDRNTTIIDGGGSGHVVQVSNNAVNVSGFTIQNCGSNWNNAGIYVASDYNTISNNNVILNGNFGIWVYDSSSNIISYNNLSSNGNEGISLYYSTNNNILNNTLWSNEGSGINLKFSSNNNAVSSNIISDNQLGVYLRESTNNDVLGNTISSNNCEGVYLRESTNNDVLGNTISSNNCEGVKLRESHNNTFSENNIVENNNYGINISSYYGCSNNNNIYHNNFINNTQNAYDECTNNWYNATLQEGNYWDDYTGEDNNGDGIGDTPYNISGGNNQDNSPLMTPYGPPYAEFNYTTDDKTVLFNASLSYDYDGNITSYAWDFGDGENGTGMIVNHTYDDYGTYNVTLTVTDDDNLTDNISKNVTLVDEIPPEISNIQAIPPIQLPGGYVNISATVTDNDELDDVCVVIEYPDVHVENISIIENKIGDTYYCNRTYDMIGDYTYNIWAVDVSNNDAASSIYQFTITEEFVADAGGPYSGWVNEPIQFNGYAVGGITPYSWHWDFGDGNTSDEQNPEYTYASDGNFTVILTVTDDESHTTDDTTWAEVLNDPPGAPIINGPTSGKAGETYSYTLVSEDPNGDDVFYEIDWGDGDVDPWDGPHESNTIITRDHSWDEKGDYTIRARAKDVHGAIGNWSTLEVTMPKNKQSVYSLFLHFLQKFIQRFPILKQILLLFPVFNKLLNFQ